MSVSYFQVLCHKKQENLGRLKSKGPKPEAESSKLKGLFNRLSPFSFELRDDIGLWVRPALGKD